MSGSDQQAVNNAVEFFLEPKVIKCSSIQDKGFLLQFLTIKEPNNVRPILGCRNINWFIKWHHFKVEEIPALQDIIKKVAYIVVPIHPKSRKFLLFSHKG